MQSKLIKYEWKAFKKPMWIISAIIVIMTAICCLMLTLFPVDLTNDQTDVISTLSTIGSFAVYYIVIIGCGLATTLLIGIRYYKSMYSDQAYLTHTLPVTKKELLSSKIIVASIFEFVICMVIMLSVIFIIPTFVISLSGASGWQEMMNEIIMDSAFGISSAYAGIILAVLYVIVLMIGSFSSTILVFTAITLGQYFTKHRIIGAVLCYMGITAVQSTISMIGYLPFYIRTLVSASTGDPSIFSVISMYTAPSILCFIFAIVLLLITSRQLNKNLNLE